MATKAHDPSHAMQTILPNGGGSAVDLGMINYKSYKFNIKKKKKLKN